MTNTIDGLYAAIMNLPRRPPASTPPDWSWNDGYRFGHRDARYAAAELASAVAAQSETELRELHERWPGGLDEIEASLNAWRKRAEAVAPSPEVWLKEAERLVQRFEATCQCWHQGDGEQADLSVFSSRNKLLAHLRTLPAASPAKAGMDTKAPDTVYSVAGASSGASKTALPELPNGAYGVYDDYYDGTCVGEPYDRWHDIELFSADQMREYGAACIQAAGAQKQNELSSHGPMSLRECVEAEEPAAVAQEPVAPCKTQGECHHPDTCEIEGKCLRAAPQAAPDALRESHAELIRALKKIDAATFSHVDGRDLFQQMHPRNMLDIKRRVDGRETWFEGDWLTTLWDAIKEARPALVRALGVAHD